MFQGFYPIIVIVVAFIAILSGFRKGLTGQPSSLLGVAFGAVAAKILTPEFADSCYWVNAVSPSPDFNEFIRNLVCAITIYSITFLLFSIISPILRAALSVIQVGIFNRILGAFLSLLKNLLWVSLVFNLLLCLRPESGLMMYERADDGNLVAAVMAMTPAILGCYGADDFAHFHQLKEAKSISCNFRSPQNVILQKVV